jgi:hypothetical protein
MNISAVSDAERGQATEVSMWHLEIPTSSQNVLIARISCAVGPMDRAVLIEDAFLTKISILKCYTRVFALFIILIEFLLLPFGEFRTRLLVHA